MVYTRSLVKKLSCPKVLENVEWSPTNIWCEFGNSYLSRRPTEYCFYGGCHPKVIKSVVTLYFKAFRWTGSLMIDSFYVREQGDGVFYRFNPHDPDDLRVFCFMDKEERDANYSHYGETTEDTLLRRKLQLEKWTRENPEKATNV